MLLIHDRVRRDSGEIAFIKSVKAPIDDCTEEEEEFDLEEVRIRTSLSDHSDAYADSVIY